jgi:UDP-glucose 4-epimerase
MKVLITGGMGYIGTNLHKHLDDKGHKVTIWDRKHPCNLWVEVVSRHYLESRIRPDVIVHLAALPGIKQCEADIRLAVNDNIITTENIFSIADKNGIPVIFTSSQAVKSPTNTYSMTKYVGEQIVKKYHGNILRLSNVYGGNGYLTKKTSVIANFVNAKMNNQPIIIHGDGSQTRDFIHVEEVCRAIELCLCKFNLTMDIGTGIPRSIKEVAEMLNYDKIEYMESATGVSSGTSEVSTAKKTIGFVARDKLTEYLTA